MKDSAEWRQGERLVKASSAFGELALVRLSRRRLPLGAGSGHSCRGGNGETSLFVRALLQLYCLFPSGALLFARRFEHLRPRFPASLRTACRPALPL